MLGEVWDMVETSDQDTYLTMPIKSLLINDVGSIQLDCQHHSNLENALLFI